MWAAEFPLAVGVPLPYLAFCRQLLPDAQEMGAESIRRWADALFGGIVQRLPADRPWSLSIEPHYGSRSGHRSGARAWHTALHQEGVFRRPVPAGNPTVAAAAAGRQRCRLIREELLEILGRKRRSLLRHLRWDPAPFTGEDSHVQVLLTGPETGFLSLALAPTPCEQGHLIWPFPKGEITVPADKAAPSRAFAKLAEAELRLGQSIQDGDLCVDLGSAPGSWTYTAVKRGARVIAVDRSPLRDDLMRCAQVRFEAADVFRFRPPEKIDWLLCDVIAPAERTTELLAEWLQSGKCRQFVVTLKLKDGAEVELLSQAKVRLPGLTRRLFITRLCANKREVCVFGSAR